MDICIDIENKCINGCTNICLVPHFSTLRDIRLNCRQCEVLSVFHISFYQQTIKITGPNNGELTTKIYFLTFDI